MTRMKIFITMFVAVLFMAPVCNTGISPVHAAESALKITVISGNSIRLDWQDNVDNERGFRIERRTGSGNFVLRAVAGPNVTGYYDRNVHEGGVYTYRVLVINNKGEFETYTNEVSVSTLSVKRPSLVKLIPLSGTEIEITWEYPGLGGFATLIERNKLGNSGWEQVAYIPEGIYDFQDSGLEPDTLYYYRIRAVGGPDVYSDYYPSKNGRAIYTPPNGPEGLYGFVDNTNRIVLSWDDADNVSSYVIERRKEGGDFIVVGFTGRNKTEWRDRNTVEGVFYTYRVKALKGSRESFYSNEVKINCYYVAPPVSLLAESTEGNTIKLEWTDNKNMEGNYEVYRRMEGDTEWSLLTVLPIYMREYADMGLPESTRYFYRIRVSVEYRGAESMYSNQVSAMTSNLPPPYNLRYRVWDENHIRLMWSYKSGVYVSGFRIERKRGDGAWTDIGGVPSNTMSFYDTIEFGEGYHYRVKAYDNIRNMVSYGEPLSAVLGVPEAPANLEVVGISCREVELVWADESMNEEGYIVERRKVGAGLLEIAILPANSTGYMDRDVVPGTAYAYQIKAFNKTGSSVSPTVYIRTDREVVYEDVPTEHRSARTIEVLASRGIIDSGEPFRPDEHVTRAEFTAWVVRSLALREIPVGSFMDVRYGDEFYPEIMTAWKLGIAEGDNAGRFRPGDIITREDIAAIVFRALEAVDINMVWYQPSVLESCPDRESISEYSLTAFAGLVKERIILLDDGMLKPKSGMTRSDAAETVMKLVFFIESEKT